MVANIEIMRLDSATLFDLAGVCMHAARLAVFSLTSIESKLGSCRGHNIIVDGGPLQSAAWESVLASLSIKCGGSWSILAGRPS
jgi:hypothetical protein